MIKAKVLVVDNLDSFTFTLVDYLKSEGAAVDVARSNAMTVDEALARPADAILISPGPGTPQEAGISVPLAAACIAQKLPLLGVCLGHQAIAVACGSPVERVAPIHGKIGPVRHDETGIFADLPSPFFATRYHSLGVTEVKPPLVGNAWSEDGVVMALRHQSAPVHGVQFHPESIGSEFGHRMIRTFFRLARP